MPKSASYDLFFLGATNDSRIFSAFLHSSGNGDCQLRLGLKMAGDTLANEEGIGLFSWFCRFDHLPQLGEVELEIDTLRSVSILEVPALVRELEQQA